VLIWFLPFKSEMGSVIALDFALKGSMDGLRREGDAARQHADRASGGSSPGMVPVWNGRKTHGYCHAEQDLAKGVECFEADTAKTANDQTPTAEDDRQTDGFTSQGSFGRRLVGDGCWFRVAFPSRQQGRQGRRPPSAQGWSHGRRDDQCDWLATAFRARLLGRSAKKKARPGGD
jgi:hypothetical protein